MKREFAQMHRKFDESNKRFDAMDRKFDGFIKGLAALANQTQDAYAAMKRVDAGVGQIRSEMATKIELKAVKTDVKKLATRFDDFLAQDDAERSERRTTSESAQRRLDNHERRLQRLEARPS